MHHIAVITTSFPHDTAGAEAAGSFVYDFVGELSKSVKVSVIAPGLQHVIDKQESFTVYRFAVPHLPLSTLKISNPLLWPAILKTLRAGAMMTETVAASGKPDHVFALWALPSGYWARMLKRKYKIKYSIWALGSDIWAMRDKPVLHNILRKTLQEAELCFADGYQLRQDVIDISGRDCHFLPSARVLQHNALRKKNDQPPYNLAFLGRWHPNKGADLLLESLGHLNEDDWKKIRELRICGGGPLQDQMVQKTGILANASRPVSLHGYLSKVEAFELINWADYLLIPSRIESIPVVFSDALQCRTPVIAMPVGDLPELVNRNKSGILAKEVTAKAYSVAIREALHGTPDVFTSGMQVLSEQFDIHRIVADFLRHAGTKTNHHG